MKVHNQSFSCSNKNGKNKKSKSKDKKNFILENMDISKLINLNKTLKKNINTSFLNCSMENHGNQKTLKDKLTKMKKSTQPFTNIQIFDNLSKEVNDDLKLLDYGDEASSEFEKVIYLTHHLLNINEL